MERVASRAHRMGRHRWASPLKLRRHPTSATTALLLAASCGLAADVLASSCTSPAGCSVGDYCDDGSDCYECSYISRQRCDARDGDCCSAAFCHNCPSDPHGCCSSPSPSPSPGGLSCGTNCQWIYAASASYTCSTACSNHHAGWTCYSGSTWPTLSRADFKAVTGISCASYASGSTALNPMIESSNECYYHGSSQCSGSTGNGQSRRLCPCKTPPPPPTICAGADQNLPEHGTKGDCGSTLAASAACHPGCQSGYISGGGRLCLAGNLVDTATCSARQCPAKSPATHGTECQLGRYGEGDCKVECADGYFGPAKQYTCGANGEWKPPQSGALSCSQVTCPAEPPPGVEHATSCAAGSYPDGTCRVKCLAGYTATGSRLYKCAGDGRWEEGNGQCIPTPNLCQGVPSSLIQIKKDSSCKRTVQNVCHFECIEGYDAIGGDTGYTCGSDGTWSSSDQNPLQCEKLCSVTPPAPGSKLTLPCARKPGSGQECKARCDDGYEKVSGTGVYKCNGNAKWKAQGDALMCKLTGCAEAAKLEHGTICPSGEVGDKVHPKCAAGYAGSGKAEYTCEPNKQWQQTGDDVVCQAIPNFCPTGPVEGSANVEIRGDEHCDGKVSTRCAPSCSDGSERVAGAVQPGYECQPDRTWKPEGAQLVCEKTCDGAEPAEPHVKILDSCESRGPQKRCQAECEAGYTPAGGIDHYICRQSGDGSRGEWHDGSLECVVSCEAGFAPIDLNETKDSSVPCAGCESGRFSSDGVDCLECPKHNENHTRCFECPEGQGPNPKTRDRESNTLCEVCSDRLLISEGGVCVPPGAENIADEIQNLWDRETPVERGLTVVGVVLTVALMLCCCGRAAGREKALYYLPDLIVAAAGLIFVSVAVVFGHKSKALAEGNYQDIPYDVLCSVTTAITVLFVPTIIRRYRWTIRTLADSADFPRLQQHNTYLGPFGLLFFLWGLVDWIVDLSFCYSLWHCQQPVLAGCVTVSLLVTTAMTWYLGWYTLKFIVRTDRRVPSPAREWVARSPVFGPMIVVASSSRLNSMAILRLRLCGRMLIDFPDSPDHRFFHFMRNAGMYHYLVEDIPHAVISLVAIKGGESMQCQSEVDLFAGLPVQVKPEDVAWYALWVSIISMVLGMLTKSFQMIAMTIMSDTGTEPRDWQREDEEERYTDGGGGGSAIPRGSLAAAVARIERELAHAGVGGGGAGDGAGGVSTASGAFSSIRIPRWMRIASVARGGGDLDPSATAAAAAAAADAASLAGGRDASGGDFLNPGRASARPLDPHRSLHRGSEEEGGAAPYGSRGGGGRVPSGWRLSAGETSMVRAPRAAGGGAE